MDEFKPELVLISAGFDSRLGDPLGQFRLNDEDFADLTRMLMDIADEYAGGPAGLGARGRLQSGRVGGRCCRARQHADSCLSSVGPDAKVVEYLPVRP